MVICLGGFRHCLTGDDLVDQFVRQVVGSIKQVHPVSAVFSQLRAQFLNRRAAKAAAHLWPKRLGDDADPVLAEPR